MPAVARTIMPTPSFSKQSISNPLSNRSSKKRIIKRQLFGIRRIAITIDRTLVAEGLARKADARSDILLAPPL
jgi:hypothetical protein